MKKIQLSAGNGEYKFTLVDDSDFEWLNQWTWGMGGKYAVRKQYLGGGKKNAKYQTIFMHRVLADTPIGMDTDHINRNKLDNRRMNLRICSRAQNMINAGLRVDNTSGHKGISWSADRNRWIVHVYVNGKSKSLGRFTELDDAIDVHKKEYNKPHGEFASN